MPNLKPALVVVYNHKYPQNIPIIEEIYAPRFARIYHLMPFYQPQKRSAKKYNIISVYDSSHYFQGFMAQGLQGYYQKDTSHYIFLADDLFLNPKINQDNYQEYFGLSADTAYISRLNSLETPFLRKGWDHNYKSYGFVRKPNGLNEIRELPSFNEAMKKFKLLGLATDNFNEQAKPLIIMDLLASVYCKPHPRLHPLYWLIQLIRIKNKLSPYRLNYPLVWGGSDIVIVAGSKIHKFCHYCGIFAAANLFVEIAVPTSMVLTHDKISLIENLVHKRVIPLKPAQTFSLLVKNDNSIRKLLQNWPDDYLYLHPVKISLLAN